MGRTGASRAEPWLVAGLGGEARTHALPGWMELEGAGQGPAQQGAPCALHSGLSVGRRHSDQKESASLLVLVMSLCWRAVRDQQAHQTPTPHSEKLPNPRGFRFVLVFTHQLWFLEASKLGQLKRTPHPQPGSPSEVACAAHQAWPRGPAMREVPPNSPSPLSWEQMAEVNVALGVASPGAPPQPWGSSVGGPGSASWDFPQGAGKRRLLSQLRARFVSLPGGTLARKCQPPVSRCQSHLLPW